MKWHPRRDYDTFFTSPRTFEPRFNFLVRLIINKLFFLCFFQLLCGDHVRCVQEFVDKQLAARSSDRKRNDVFQFLFIRFIVVI